MCLYCGVPPLSGLAFYPLFGANSPTGPLWQSLAMDVQVAALPMFVFVAVAAYRRALGLPAGLAIGGAMALNVLWR